MKSLKKKTNRPNAWDADVKRLGVNIPKNTTPNMFNIQKKGKAN